MKGLKSSLGLGSGKSAEQKQKEVFTLILNSLPDANNEIYKKCFANTFADFVINNENLFDHDEIEKFQKLLLSIPENCEFNAATYRNLNREISRITETELADSKTKQAFVREIGETLSQQTNESLRLEDERNLSAKINRETSQKTRDPNSRVKPLRKIDPIEQEIQKAKMELFFDENSKMNLDFKEAQIKSGIKGLKNNNNRSK